MQTRCHLFLVETFNSINASRCLICTLNSTGRSLFAVDVAFITPIRAATISSGFMLNAETKQLRADLYEQTGSTHNLRHNFL